MWQLRQEGCQEFDPSLGYTEKLCPQKRERKKETKQNKKLKPSNKQKVKEVNHKVVYRMISNTHKPGSKHLKAQTFKNHQSNSWLVKV